jgi:L-threonine kinase
VLQLHQVHGQSVHLRLYSEIPRGRGYGSSTVDVGACLYAVSRALGRELEPGEAARLAVAIEPTDSTLFPGLTLFDHRRGSFSRFLGGAPALDVVVIDPGGYVDTVAFNRRDLRQALQRLTETHREAFELLGHGLASGDAPAIGQAATLSARAHQSILHNPLLEDVLRLAREIDALGVCRAHSGTILGVLLDRSNTDLAACSRFLRRRLPTGVEISSYPLVDGGPRILRTDSILENRQHS